MACKTAEVTQILSSKRKQEKHKCFCYQTSPHTKVTFFYSGNSHAPDQTQQARETPLRARVQGQRCYMSPTQNTDQVTRLLQYQKKKKNKDSFGSSAFKHTIFYRNRHTQDGASQNSQW